MRRLALGAAGLLWLQLLSAAAAQEAVQLRYRFQPGQELRYQMTVSGDLGMTMGAPNLPAGVVPGKIPITMSAAQVWVHKVKSVTPEGVATVSVSCEKLDTNMAFMGMNVTSRLGPDGKLETLMNGQPAAIPGAGNATIPNPLMEVNVDPTGKMTGATAGSLTAMNQALGGQNFSSMLAGTLPGINALLLPTKPVKPGDVWESKWSMKIPVPLPGPPGGPTGAAPILTMNYAVVNKLLRVEDGRAVIETRVTVTAPSGTKMGMSEMPGAMPGMSMRFDKMEQSMVGTQRFQIEEGRVEGSDADATLGMQMAMLMPSAAPPPPAAPKPKAVAKKPAARSQRGTTPRPPAGRSATPAPAAAAPMELKIGMDGTLKVKVERVAAPEAAVTP